MQNKEIYNLVSYKGTARQEAREEDILKKDSLNCLEKCLFHSQMHKNQIIPPKLSEQSMNISIGLQKFKICSIVYFAHKKFSRWGMDYLKKVCQRQTNC